MERQYTEDGTTVFTEGTSAKDKFRTAGTLPLTSDPRLSIMTVFPSLSNVCLTAHLPLCASLQGKTGGGIIWSRKVCL